MSIIGSLQLEQRRRLYHALIDNGFNVTTLQNQWADVRCWMKGFNTAVEMMEHPNYGCYDGDQLEKLGIILMDLLEFETKKEVRPNESR